MRIVAGSHKGRRLAVPEGRDVRPTSDRARQALFNILAHSDRVELEGAVVIDAFAGSGALAFEALSRGAAQAYLFEDAAPALAAIKANMDVLGESRRSLVVRGDATKPPAAEGYAVKGPANLALLDPPYRTGLAAPCLDALAARGWLASACLCVVEVAAKEDFTPPPGFERVDERVYGAAKLVFVLAPLMPAAP